MKGLILAIAAFFVSAGPVHAEVIWACDGFVYSDGSKSDSFVLKDDGQTLSFYLEMEHLLEHAATNEIIGYEIFIHKEGTTASKAYYIREDEDQLEIQQHGWYFSQSASTCYRQR